MSGRGARGDTRTPASDEPACRGAGHDLADAEVAADLRILSAAGSETRYEALRLIADADGEICVCEIEPALGVSQGAVSQALSRLFAAGLVTRRKDGRWRYYDTSPAADRLLDVLADVRTVADE